MLEFEIKCYASSVDLLNLNLRKDYSKDEYFLQQISDYTDMYEEDIEIAYIESGIRRFEVRTTSNRCCLYLFECQKEGGGWTTVDTRNISWSKDAICDGGYISLCEYLVGLL